MSECDCGELYDQLDSVQHVAEELRTAIYTAIDMLDALVIEEDTNPERVEAIIKVLEDVS